MNPLAVKFAEENAWRKKQSKVLTNRTTIIAWRLFHSNRTMHFGFILFRLKKDFGMTEWDIANLTGIPTKIIDKFIRAMKPILESGILKELAKMDFVEEEEGWRALPQRGHNQPQGYFIPKSKEWYAKYKPRTKNPIFSLGAETEKELLGYLKQYGLIEDNS